MSLRTSDEWVAYFRCNAERGGDMDWDLPAGWRGCSPLVRSLQAWQLGETSDGRHLLAASRKYADKVGDPGYVEAIRWFIREEQKHGENLGRYVEKCGVPRLRFDWGDYGFRRVRYFLTSMEIWTTAVILIEGQAQLYYGVARDHGGCPLLAQICSDILRDEAPHLEFQYERLARLWAKRSAWGVLVTQVMHGFLFLLVVGAVWTGHRAVFRLAGWELGDYVHASCRKLRRAWERVEWHRESLSAKKARLRLTESTVGAAVS